MRGAANLSFSLSLFLSLSHSLTHFVPLSAALFPRGVCASLKRGRGSFSLLSFRDLYAAEGRERAWKLHTYTHTLGKEVGETFVVSTNCCPHTPRAHTYIYIYERASGRAERLEDGGVQGKEASASDFRDAQKTGVDFVFYALKRK